MSPPPGPERLHKVLAHAGVASRRKCEDLIRQGRVRVNGEIVREMGIRADPATDVVEVDDVRIRPERPVHLLLYKPKDYLCTTSDQWGRKTILDLLPHHRATRLFTVGRLDFDAEGLVVVTNDGDFAHEVLHPRRQLPRTYYVKVRGNLSQETIRRAREGVWLSDGRTPPMDVRLLRAGREISTAKCTLVERHHHQLRRIWSKLGAPVLRLVLIRIGEVGTQGLSKGRARPLTAEEIAELRSGAPGRSVAPERRRPGAKASSSSTSDAPAGSERERPKRSRNEAKASASSAWGAPVRAEHERPRRPRAGAKAPSPTWGAAARPGQKRRERAPQRGRRAASSSSGDGRSRKRGR